MFFFGVSFGESTQWICMIIILVDFSIIQLGNEYQILKTPVDFSALAFFWPWGLKEQASKGSPKKKGHLKRRSCSKSGIAISKKKSMTSPSLGTLSCQLRFIGRGAPLHTSPCRVPLICWSICYFQKAQKKHFQGKAWKNHGKTLRMLPLRATDQQCQPGRKFVVTCPGIALTWDCKRW